MNPFQFKDFKNLCYQIEGLLNRSWTLSELSGENYPKSFYLARFSSKDADKRDTFVLCSKLQPVFAFVDASATKTTDAFNSGFIENKEIEAALTTLMQTLKIDYNVLRPQVLYLEFNGKADFEYKLKALGVKESDITTTLKVMRPDLFNYKLFHGRNIGLDLFNSEDD